MSIGNKSFYIFMEKVYILIWRKFSLIHCVTVKKSTMCTYYDILNKSCTTTKKKKKKTKTKRWGDSLCNKVKLG